MILPDGTAYVEEGTTPPSDKLVTKFRTWPAAKGRAVIGQFDFRTYEVNHWLPRDEAWKTDVPATVHMIVEDKNEFLPLTEERQWFYLKTHMIGWPGISVDAAIARQTKLLGRSVCFTDGGNAIQDGCKNILAKINMSSTRLQAVKMSIVTAGSPMLWLYGSTVQAIDPDHLPSDPAAHYKEHPEMYVWLTQSSFRMTGLFEWRGGQKRPVYECPPFPHGLEGKPYDGGTLWPVVAPGGKMRFMEGWRMKQIPNDAEYSPYVLRPDGGYY